MSCIFCNSSYHLSPNCQNFVSNEERKVVAQEKKLCEECLSRNCTSKTSTECKSLTACFICYSKNHNTVFCPDRITASNFFVPNIDRDLFPRFLAMLDSYERQFLAFQSPAILNLCTTHPFRIVNTLNIGSLDNYSGPNIFCKLFELCGFQTPQKYKKTLKNITSKKWELYAENIEISNVSLSANEFYSLLSPRTKFLKLRVVKITGAKITLDEIFKNSPNLEEFEYEFGNNKKVNANYMLNENFFKYKYGRKFKHLKITLYTKFDVANLIPILEKSSSKIKIDLYVNVPIMDIKKCDELFMRKISEYFVPSSCSPYLSIYIEKWGYVDKILNHSYHLAGTFALKNKTSKNSMKNCHLFSILTISLLFICLFLLPVQNFYCILSQLRSIFM